MANYKINGLPGFGFPGETGDKGINGKNTLFSPICYVEIDGKPYSKMSETERIGKTPFLDIPFLSDLNEEKYYAKIDDTSINISDGDLIIISGIDSVSIFKITLYENSILCISEKVYDITLSEIPYYQFDCTHALIDITGSTNKKIKLYPTFSIANSNNTRIDIIISQAGSSSVETIKEYNENIKYDDSKSSGVTLQTTYNGNTDSNMLLILYYKVSPYKIVKAFLKQIMFY